MIVFSCVSYYNEFTEVRMWTEVISGVLHDGSDVSKENDPAQQGRVRKE